jgi:hypothetical protein
LPSTHEGRAQAAIDSIAFAAPVRISAEAEVGQDEADDDDQADDVNDGVHVFLWEVSGCTGRYTFCPRS